jgi:hypothetical protein
MSGATSATTFTPPRMSRSLSSGAHSRDLLAHQGYKTLNVNRALRMKGGSPHNIPDSSSSAFAINSSLTTTVRRGTMKNIAEAQAIESVKIAAVSGSVVVEWPPR